MKSGTTVSSEHCLDVCEMVPGPKTSLSDRHPMTLLAFAGYYARNNMLEFLVLEGASKCTCMHLTYMCFHAVKCKIADVDMGNQFCGTPLLQMMTYAQIQQKQHQLSLNIVQFFIDNGAVLSRVLTAGMCENSSALEMSINLCRFDIAQKLIKARVDPIEGGDPDMKPIFLEYAQFGTNHFIKWLLGEHLKRDEVPAFMQRLLDGKVFFNPATNHYVSKIMGRNTAHTFLLSGHEEAVSCLLSRKPDLLKECDPFGKSALHLAAEKGDSVSVTILLDR